MLASGLLFAQPASQSDLELCASLETDELKLACFEALTARYSQPPVADAMPEPTTAPDAATSAHVVQETPAPEPAAAESKPVPADPALAPVPAASEPAAVAESRSPVEPATPTDNAADDDDGFNATVVRVTTDRRLRRHTFEMENGEVWRQVESDRLHVPRNRPFDVEVRRGLMGDYQMRIEGEGRMTRIKRLR